VADGLGAKIGTRVAALSAKARVDTAQRLAPLFVQTGMALQDEFFRLTGTELANTVGSVYQAILDQADDTTRLKPLLQFLTTSRGQMSTIVGLSGISSGFGQTVGALLSNDLNPLITTLIARTPNGILSVADSVAMAAKRIGDLTFLANEAAGQGINRDRFGLLTQLAALTHSAVDILDLLNRRVITHDGALFWLRRAGYDDDAAQQFLALANAVISVQDLAEMKVKGIITVDQGRTLAGLTGYSPEDYDRYELLAGEPPALDTLFLAWRRGVITETDVDRGIRQSHLRDEWIPTAKSMRWVPLDVSEVVAGVVQNHITTAEGVAMAALVGVTPELFNLLVENHGNPPSPTDALEWFNRGLIDRAMFDQIFRESHTKDKYIPLFFNARHRLLTLAEIRLLFRDGAMTRDEAITRLLDLGHTPENAAIIINGASAQRTAKARDLTRDQVVALYRDQIITADDARSMLHAMGWDDQDAQWIIDLANLQRLQVFMNAAISRVRSQYVAYRIDSNTASAALDSLQVATDARDSYLTLWDIERSVSTKELTTAEVISAAKKQIITADDAYNRLLGQGYAADDAAIKLAIAGLSATTTTTGGA